MEKNIPTKYQSSSFDPYLEVIDLLCDPKSLPVEYDKLQRLASSFDAIAGQNIDQSQNEVTVYLGNLRESEEIMIDYLAYIQELRNELKNCKKLLQEKQRDVKAIWLNGIYNGTIAKGFEQVEEIIENLYSIDLLIKEKMHLKAAEVIKTNIKVIDESDYGYISVSQRIKEAFTKKLRKLSDQIIEEIKCFLLLKHNSYEIELKKYSVVGLLNISYLLNEDEEKENTDNSIPVSSLIDALASIEQLNRIENLSMWDIQSDIQELYKKCFAQFPTLPDEEEYKSSHVLSSIIPQKNSRETAMKVFNSVTAVAALVIRNHFLLKQSLNRYKYTFSMGSIWEKIQKEILDVFRTIVKIPEKVNESIAADLLSVEEKESTYSSLLGSILELNAYHFPYLYYSITTYLSQFHSIIQEGNLVSYIEDFTLQFIEILKNDTCKMFSACMATNDAFRYNKSTDSLFVCCSVLNSNFQTLIEIKSEVPEKYSFYIIEIAVNLVALFFKDLNALMEKQTKDSKFYSLFLENSEIFQEIRLEKLYEQVRLEVPESIYYPFTKALGYINEKKGILEETEKSFLKFNAIGKSSFIGESAKVRFI
jgi:hypothetical protein